MAREDTRRVLSQHFTLRAPVHLGPSKVTVQPSLSACIPGSTKMRASSALDSLLRTAVIDLAVLEVLRLRILPLS